MAIHDSSKSVSEICFENDLLRKENHSLKGNLRDQFVIAAMMPVMALLLELLPSNKTDKISESTVATMAYTMADAMLAAREAS